LPSVQVHIKASDIDIVEKGCASRQSYFTNM